MSERPADVAVIGAGLAGLVAARRLVDAGLDVVVIEARDRVGGRTLNHDLGDGKVVEVGGQWIGPTQDALAALASQLGVRTFPTYSEGKHLVEWGGRLRRFRSDVPKIGLWPLASVGLGMRAIDKLAAEVSPERPWEGRRAAAQDAQTFQTWLDSHVHSRGGRELLELATQAVWGAEPGDVSLLHVLFYTRSAGSFEEFIRTSGGAQESRFVGGSQRLSVLMADALGDRVILGSPLRSVKQSAAGVRLSSRSVEVRARRTILAISPTLATRLEYDPPLPGHPRPTLPAHGPGVSHQMLRCL